MIKTNLTNSKGFTIIELMVGLLIAGMVILGMGSVLADSVRGWNMMYNQVYSEVITDSRVAKRVFDRVIRQASPKNIVMDGMGQWVQVQYYQNLSSTALDRYARFYTLNGELKVERGHPDTFEIFSTQTVCSNVSSCIFQTTEGSVQMILQLDNGSENITVVSSAIAYN